MNDGWCPFATIRPITIQNYATGRKDAQVIAVVLHIAAGKLAAVFPTFNNPNTHASAHFCIGKDGTIEQYVSINDTAYGNGLRWQDNHWVNSRGKTVRPSWQELIPQINPNSYTVSIEHEGQPQDAWTPQMYSADIRLLLWIARQFNLTYIPHHTLIGHYEIDPLDRPNCPGPNVEFDRIANDIAALVSANNLTWMPINTDATIFKFAQANDLGYPQSDEFELIFENDTYVAQVFNLGIVYVKKGEWGTMRWVSKS